MKNLFLIAVKILKFEVVIMYSVEASFRLIIVKNSGNGDIIKDG